MAVSYPRDRIETVLAGTELPPSYRIIPRRYLDTPLGTAPGDSRFCAREDGFTVLYATPDFRRRVVGSPGSSHSACATRNPIGIQIKIIPT